MTRVPGNGAEQEAGFESCCQSQELTTGAIVHLRDWACCIKAEIINSEEALGRRLVRKLVSCTRADISRTAGARQREDARCRESSRAPCAGKCVNLETYQANLTRREPLRAPATNGVGLCVGKILFHSRGTASPRRMDPWLFHPEVPFRDIDEAAKGAALADLRRAARGKNYPERR